MPAGDINRGCVLDHRAALRREHSLDCMLILVMMILTNSVILCKRHLFLHRDGRCASG